MHLKASVAPYVPQAKSFSPTLQPCQPPFTSCADGALVEVTHSSFLQLAGPASQLSENAKPSRIGCVLEVCGLGSSYTGVPKAALLVITQNASRSETSPRVCCWCRVFVNLCLTTFLCGMIFFLNTCILFSTDLFSH